LLEAFDAIRDELMAAFGGSSESLIKSIAEAIDNAAISAIDFAKYIVDGIGIAGVEWNAFKVVVETVEQGFRAVAYTLGEVLLELMKVANFATGGALSEGVKEMAKGVDELYDRMAEGENKIAGYKKAEDEWAISTGHVNEALERIQARMEKAKKDHEEGAEVTEEHAEKTKQLGDAADAAGKKIGELGDHVRLTKEEQKKYNDALNDMASVGGKWKETLDEIDGEVVEGVKYYLEAGVSLDKLAAAYRLTDVQAKAIETSWKQGTDTLKTQIKAAEELGQAWTQYYAELSALTATDLQGANNASLAKYTAHIKMLQDMGVADEKYYDDAFTLYQADVRKNEQALILADANSKAHKQQELANAKEKYDLMTAHSDQYTAADIANQGKIVTSLKSMLTHWGDINAVIDKQTEMVRTLSGEVISLKEAEARKASGNSMTYDLSNAGGIANYRAMNPGAQINLSDAEIIKFIKSGGTLQQLIQNGQINPYGNWGRGGGMPSMSEGGVGDFGSGTLAMLHGHEAVIPLDKSGMMGGVVINITSHDANHTAQLVEEHIMSKALAVRKFGSAVR